ncbi:MAG: hypothetical protein HYR96_06720 [Deltaproteobacteria bacterium]|nr:hypothetical protein [Deltaproteobacteria bacterium]MBI3296445.1 hypothetical protein [Deltaproteobacteria bacterium]
MKVSFTFLALTVILTPAFATVRYDISDVRDEVKENIRQRYIKRGQELSGLKSGQQITITLEALVAHRIAGPTKYHLVMIPVLKTQIEQQDKETGLVEVSGSGKRVAQSDRSSSPEIEFLLHMRYSTPRNEATLSTDAFNRAIGGLAASLPRGHFARSAELLICLKSRLSNQWRSHVVTCASHELKKLERSTSFSFSTSAKKNEGEHVEFSSSLK